MSIGKSEHAGASLHLVTLTPEFVVDVPANIEVRPAWQCLLTVAGQVGG